MLMKKTFWQQLFTATPTTGKEKYSAAELRNLYDVLQRNALVTDVNRALVVETIRSVAEFIIWGDQNEPKVFDFFLENNIMLYLHTVLLQSPTNRSGEVAKQVLQTLSIIIQNVRSETGIFFLFSNNHINNIVEVRFDFEDEEVLGYYISFLKTISLKLNKRTVQFFFDLKAGMTTFPLYSEACKFAHHKEGMVRAGVRTLTLNVYSVEDPYIQQYITSPGAASYFHELCGYVAEQIRILDRRMAAAQGLNPQALSSLDSQIAEVEDMLSYISDILATGSPILARLVSQHLWGLLAGPYWLQPLLGYDSGCRVAADETGSGVDSATSRPPVRAQCSLYVLERLFCTVVHKPLLHNLVFALFGVGCSSSPSASSSPPSSNPPTSMSNNVAVGSKSSTSPALPLPLPQTLSGLIEAADQRTASAALRLLVSIMQNKSIAPEVLQAVSLLPSARLPDLRSCCPQGACMACRLEDSMRCRSSTSGAAAPTAPAGRTSSSSGGGGSDSRVSDSGVPAFACGRVFPYLTLWDQQSKARANQAVASTPTGRTPAASLHTHSSTGLLHVPTEDLQSSPQPAHQRNEQYGVDDISIVSSAQLQSQVSPLSYGVQQLVIGAGPIAEEVASISGSPHPPAPQSPSPSPASPQCTPQPSFTLDLLNSIMPEGYTQPEFATHQTSPDAGNSDLVRQAEQQHGSTSRPGNDPLSLENGTPHPLDTFCDPLSAAATEEGDLQNSPLTHPLMQTAFAHNMPFAASPLFRARNDSRSLLSSPSSHLTQPLGNDNEPSSLTSASFSDRASSLYHTEPECLVSTDETLQPLQPVELPHIDVLPAPTPGMTPDASTAQLDTLVAEALPCLLHYPPSTAPDSDSQARMLLHDHLFDVLQVPLLPVSTYWNAIFLISQLQPRSTIDHPLPSPGMPHASSETFSSSPGSGVESSSSAYHTMPTWGTSAPQSVSAPETQPSLNPTPHATAAHDPTAVLSPASAQDPNMNDISSEPTHTNNPPSPATASLKHVPSSLPSSTSTAEASSPDPSPTSRPTAARTWVYEVSLRQRLLLQQLLHEVAERVLGDLGNMWCEAVFPLLIFEWPHAFEGSSRPVLRASAEDLMVGPALYPKARGKFNAGVSTQRAEMGLSNSAICALHTYHHVQQLVALLQLHSLLSSGAASQEAPLPSHQGWEQRPDDIMEGQHVELKSGSAISCVVSFAPGQEKRVYFAAGGVALSHSASLALAGGDSRAVRSTVGTAALLHSSPAVVLADQSTTHTNTGIVLSVSPLLGADPAVDRSMGKWLHVHVRPSVRGLLKILQPAGGRLSRADIMTPMRQLADGHWVLAFQDSERAKSARSMVELHSHKLRAVYVELLQPLMDVSFE